MSAAVVVGSGRSVWDDLAVLSEIGAPIVAGASYFAVNDMTIYAPIVHHAVSHHHEKLPHWNALRTHSGGRQMRERGIVAHSSAPGPGIDRVWKEFRGGGSSSLLAVRIALALGHERVIIAGVPLDAQGYVWGDPREERVYDFTRYRRSWELAQAELAGRVSAVSGWLCELLGSPVVDQVSA